MAFLRSPRFAYIHPPEEAELEEEALVRKGRNGRAVPASLIDVAGLRRWFQEELPFANSVLVPGQGWSICDYLPDGDLPPSFQIHVRGREPATAVAAPLSVTSQMISEACGKFGDAIRHVLQALPQREADYKMRYPSSVSEICTLFNRPCLLWDGVGNDLLPMDERFTEWQSSRSSHVTVVLAPSGSGKTRMLLELAAKRFCLYLTGSRPDGGDFAGAGSRDLDEAVKWIERRIARFEHDDVDHVLSFVTGLLLVTRLYMLDFLKTLMPTLCPRDWAFFQVEYPSVRDVFLQLIDWLLCNLVPDVPINYGTSLVELSNLVDLLAKQAGWDGLVILDESQSLLNRLENKFVASGTGKPTNPVLTPLIRTLRSYGGPALFVSGTGGSMIKVRKMLESGSMKPVHVHEVYSLGGFSEKKDMVEYMNHYIDTSLLSLDLIAATFRGRRRWLVTAIEHYVVVNHVHGTQTEFFINFAKRMISQPGATLGVLRSLFEDAGRFWELVPVNLVEKLLVSYYLGGRGYVIVKEHELSVNLIHCGLAPVFAGDYHPGYDHVLGKHCLVNRDMPAILQEPLVIEALWMTKEDSLLGSAFDSFCVDASSLGRSFERFGLPGLGDGLNGKSPAAALGCGSDVPEVYKSKFELVQSAALCGSLVRSLSQDDNDYSVFQWVEDVEKNEASFPTYLHLGDVNKSVDGKPVGGPDGVFVTREVDKVGAIPRKLLHLVQFKSGVKVSMPEALKSLDIQRFCYTHNCPRLLEWARDGYVQLVMTTPLRERRPTMEDPATAVNASLVVPPLRAMIYGKKALPFVDKGVLETLRNWKPSKKKKIV